MSTATASAAVEGRDALTDELDLAIGMVAADARTVDSVVVDDVEPLDTPRSFADQVRHLRALPAPRPQAPRGPFLLVMGALLAAGLLGLLLLNTSLAQGAFVAHDLQAQTTALADQEAALVQQVAEQESPTVLERRARSLGMVPSSTPVFLRLSDGAVLGVPEPAKAPPKPKPVLPTAITSSQNAVAPTAGATAAATTSTTTTPKTTPKTSTKSAPTSSAPAKTTPAKKPKTTTTSGGNG